MSNQERPADALAAHGERLDELKAMQLKFGVSPVYAHLATLSTALAVNDIELTVKEGRRGKQVLTALRHRAGHRARRRPQNTGEISASLPLGTGVILRGTVTVKEYGVNQRVFPEGIDRSLVQRGRGTNPARLRTSEITLSRPGDPNTYASRELKVGVVATHTNWPLVAKPEPCIETIRNAPHSETLDQLFRLLDKTTELEPGAQEYPGPFLGSVLTTLPVTSDITTLAPAHFAFHEALGVPEATMQRARANFMAGVGYMGLPYELVTPSPVDT